LSVNSYQAGRFPVVGVVTVPPGGLLFFLYG